MKFRHRETGQIWTLILVWEDCVAILKRKNAQARVGLNVLETDFEKITEE